METTYTIVYHPLVVRKDIPSLDASIKQRIRKAIETKLISAPDLFSLPLRRSLKGYRKLRVGDYRVVFRIEKQRILVLAILHRSVAYLAAVRRAAY